MMMKISKYFTQNLLCNFKVTNSNLETLNFKKLSVSIVLKPKS